MQRTLVIVKPDAVQRGLVGRILARFEAKGLKIVALKMGRIDRPTAERHYAAHTGQDFYEPLIRFMVRKMLGATFGPDAEPGTIRGDFGVSNRFNLVHGSDSPEAAEEEIALFFKPEELFDWTPADWPWRYDFSTGESV